MKLKKYTTLARAGLLESLQFRVATLVTFLGNLIYLIVIYFLWKAIYSSVESGVVNGMTFSDTMIYLVLATSLFSFMEVFLVWEMHRNIQSGKIVLDIIKPLGYQPYMFSYFSGSIISLFVTTFLPTFIIIYFVSGGAIILGTNLIFFMLSIIFSIIINLCIDFSIGTICLYTQSTWGVNIMKEAIVLLLSGASIPIAFFPEPLKTIVMYLPFQAIYNSPLEQLINNDLTLSNRISMLGVQLIWVVIMITFSQLFWRKSIKVITVNGG